MKFKPIEIIKKTTANMNKTKSTKYQIEPEEVERKSLKDNNFREKKFQLKTLAEIKS